MTNQTDQTPWRDRPFGPSLQVGPTVHGAVYVANDAIRYAQLLFAQMGLASVRFRAQDNDDSVAIVVPGGVSVCRTINELGAELNRLMLKHAEGEGAALPESSLLVDGMSYYRTASAETGHAGLLAKMSEVAGRNYWIRMADDPPYVEDSVVLLQNEAAAEMFFRGGNYSNGTAAIYGKLGFINQVNGGSEFCVIREDAGSFESYSTRLIVDNNRDDLFESFADMEAATVDELRTLSYRGAAKRK